MKSHRHSWRSAVRSLSLLLVASLVAATVSSGIAGGQDIGQCVTEVEIGTDANPTAFRAGQNHSTKRSLSEMQALNPGVNLDKLPKGAKVCVARESVEQAPQTTVSPATTTTSTSAPPPIIPPPAGPALYLEDGYSGVACGLQPPKPGSADSLVYVFCPGEGLIAAWQGLGQPYGEWDSFRKKFENHTVYKGQAVIMEIGGDANQTPAQLPGMPATTLPPFNSTTWSDWEGPFGTNPLIKEAENRALNPNTTGDDAELIAYELVRVVGEDMIVMLNHLGLSDIVEIDGAVYQHVSELASQGFSLGFILSDTTQLLESATQYDELTELYDMMPRDVWAAANSYRIELGWKEPLPAAEMVIAWNEIIMNWWDDPDEIYARWLADVMTPYGFDPELGNRWLNPAPVEPPAEDPDDNGDWPDGSMNSEEFVEPDSGFRCGDGITVSATCEGESVKPTKCGKDGVIAKCVLEDPDDIGGTCDFTKLGDCDNGFAPRPCSLLDSYDVYTAGKCEWPAPVDNTCGKGDIIARCLGPDHAPPQNGCIQIMTKETVVSCDPFKDTKKPRFNIPLEKAGL